MQSVVFKKHKRLRICRLKISIMNKGLFVFHLNEQRNTLVDYHAASRIVIPGFI